MGGTVLAICVDAIKDNKRVHDDNHLPFPVLSEAKLEAIKSYGLLFREPARDIDIALPANFLIDRSGKIVWKWVAPRVQDRVDPSVVRDQVEKLKTASP